MTLTFLLAIVGGGGLLLGDPAASARTELVVEIPTAHGTLTVGVLGRDERDVRTRLAAEVDGTLTDLQHDSVEDVPRDARHEAMATEAKAAFRAGKARVVRVGPVANQKIRRIPLLRERD